MNKIGHGPASTRSPQSQTRSRRQQQHAHRSTDAHDVVQETRPGGGGQAHTRTPVLIRESTVLEALSRGLRTYLPASMSGSPPTLRPRPLSFGSVIGAPIPTALAPALAYDSEAHDDGERITWAAWDEVGQTRVLLLTYATGLQVWDAGDLGAVRELLNLRRESLHTAGPVLSAVVLPPTGAGKDELASARPLLGVLTPTHVTIYSLATHTVIKQIPFTDPSTITARASFVVISTTHAPALHILSASTLQPLHTITLTAAPVFTLSQRLLAYASPAPASYTHARTMTPVPTFISRARDPSSVNLNLMRVGEEVWSGVKRGATFAAGLGAYDEPASESRVSRSAPAASSLPMPVRPNDGAHAWITVLDLQPLLAQLAPRPIATFVPFSPYPGIQHLAFAAGGGGVPMLCVTPRDGQRVSVFQIRCAGAGAGVGKLGVSLPWHWYDLRRGVTSARVESVVWEQAGRWAGVATGRQTVHVFPTNPYGGKPDERSHLEARVYNTSELQPLSTDLTPLVRLRPSLPSSPASGITPDAAPIAFTFLPPAASLALPPALLPQVHMSTPSSPTRTSTSTPTYSRPSPVSSPSGASSQFQDLLVFDPAAGVLALRRITLDWVAPQDSAAGVSIPGVAGYSTSLPIAMGRGKRKGEGGERAGELVGKESVVATWALKRGCEWGEVRSVLGAPGGAKSVPEVKQGRGDKVSVTDYLAQAELSTHSRSPAILPRPIYLSHQFSFYALGEDYHALLRRSHLDLQCTKIEVRKDVEVSAYAGDAESDAFIHGVADLQLDASGPLSGRDRDRRAARGSFDEPIASAMRSVLDYSGQSPPVLPMLPNGASMSVLDAIPIRTKHVAAGVNEGLGRIRREIGKVRSPILRPTRPEGRHVPLEFDEADEATFLESEGSEERYRDQDEPESRDGSGSGASMSVSTPSPRAELDAGGDDALWDAWDDEAQATVAEAEAFDEISATGFMDEEHAPIMAAMSRQKSKGKW